MNPPSGAIGAATGTLLTASSARAQTPVSPGTANAPWTRPRQAPTTASSAPRTRHARRRTPTSSSRLRPTTAPCPTRFAYADAHRRLESGGWTREITTRELPISTSMAGVNLRLNAGGVRELHWHKEAEWAYMLKGNACIAAVDELGRQFIDDVAEGDLWYFPPGIPHSIQGQQSGGCEFLLVFDKGGFSEKSTFMLTDWLKPVPRSVLAKNFELPEAAFEHLPKDHLYIFNAPMPAAMQSELPSGIAHVPTPFSHRMMAQEPVSRSAAGTVRITDSTHSRPRRPSPPPWSNWPPAP